MFSVRGADRASHYQRYNRPCGDHLQSPGEGHDQQFKKQLSYRRLPEERGQPTGLEQADGREGQPPVRPLLRLQRGDLYRQVPQQGRRWEWEVGGVGQSQLSLPLPTGRTIMRRV